MPDDAGRIVDDLRATLDALTAQQGRSDGADVADLVGRLLVQATGLARVLGVEADATAREAGARLRAAVDTVVTRAAGEGVEPATLPEAERLAAWPTAAS